MQRSFLVALILVLAAAIGCAWWLLSDPAAPPPAPSSATEQDYEVEPAVVSATGGIDGTAMVASVREAVVGRSNLLFDDPDIRAGLCGFKGRVVDHKLLPVADCGVRIYRGALDSVLRTSADLFAEAQEFEPQYIAGEVRTADDGTFKITGVWPRGIFLMFAGLDTDAPTHQVITKVPSPGQIIDLGDVVLNNAGVIVGTVNDQDGNPLAAALVRAADIPGALAALFPLERFDPEGALLIRERNSPVQVLRMPPWVKQAFDHFPIPTTHSGADGTFRLVGVIPGSNMLAITARGYLSHVKASVQVRAGAEKNVGRIRMREGEELYAKVLDEKGEPVAGAEVVAGSTLSMMPVDLASYLGETNEQGEIEGTGFAPGKVTVAARRSKHDAWVLAEPQSIIGDVVVTLPAQFCFTASVQLADGSMAKQPRFRLLHGKKGNGAAEMYLLGFAEPVKLKGRMRQLKDERWHVTGLNKGSYTLIAEVEGQATGSEVIELEDQDVEVDIKLVEPTVFSVLVVNEEDQPIRNVAIFAQARGKRVMEMPVDCGRTDKDGRLQIDKLQADSLRVSADHPRWGVVHGEAKIDEQLVLKLLAPGVLRGVLSENGKPPLPGKFTVAIMRRRDGGPRGPLQSAPQLITAAIDGTFEVTSLQPGNYSVGAVSSLDALRSPGAIFEVAQSMYVNSRTPTTQVDIVSGQTAGVQLEVGKKPLEGPTAQLMGTVMVNGRVANGYTVIARVKGQRFASVVDERGRFDLGIILAGTASVSVAGAEGGLFMGMGNNLWSSRLELSEGDQRDLTIDIMTTTISGTCYLPDGSPGAGLFVSAQGQLKAIDGHRGNARKHARTEPDGSFKFQHVPEGTWTIEARGDSGEDRWRGMIEGIEASAGSLATNLRIDMHAAMLVKGVVDLSGFAEKPIWGYVGFYRLKPEDAPDARGRHASGVGYGKDGAFVADDLSEGRYRVVLHYQGGVRGEASCGILMVPPTGLRDVRLVPQLK